MNTTEINIITILPKNDRVCHYLINNDLQKKSMKTENLLKFLIDYMGSKHIKTLNKLIWEFETFICIKETETISLLKPNKEDLLNKYKKELKTKIPKEITDMKKTNRLSKTNFDKIWKNTDLFNLR